MNKVDQWINKHENDARFWMKAMIFFAGCTIFLSAVSLIFCLTINTLQDNIAIQTELLAKQDETIELLEKKIDLLEGKAEESEGNSSEDILLEDESGFTEPLYTASFDQ